ncbi:MAG: type II secretion system protein [Candidatus Colwellbacteria bacterium]|nr:type II secretion system protein [Candidatus Colwellbacteria bacterium]
MNKFVSQKGFTLIEMVIVIAVVGILMGLAFNGIRGVQSAARDTKRTADLRSMQSYLELYFNKCGHYPGNADCTENSSQNFAGMKSVIEQSVANTGDIPEDPQKSGGASYVYGTDANNNEYVIGATMEKTKPRGSAAGTIDGVNCDAAKLFCLRS